MQSYQNMMVGLNLSEMDETTIAYAGMLYDLFKPQRIYFVHVSRRMMLPPHLLETYPEMMKPSDEAIMQRMIQSVEAHAQTIPPDQITFQVLTGTPLDELLKFTLDKQIDLVVVGRKSSEIETRQLPLNLTRKSPCSVWVVPQKAQPAIRNILVPVDFSSSAARAMTAGIAMCRQFSLKQLHALHVYDLPLGYYQTGKTMKAFAGIMLENAVGDYEDFMEKIDAHGIDLQMHYHLEKRPAPAIEKFVAQLGTDLVVTGARGRTPSAAILVGSVTERLIQLLNVPLLAVKEPDANMGFTRALLEM